jgi:hypothetical protein
MAMEIVNIEDKAFMGILLAAVEAYPSRYCGGRKPNGASPEGEVHGLLFGQRMMKGGETTVYNVTLAVSNQIVLERSGEGVSVSTVHIDRIREVTELFPAYSLLGFFHSHPYPKTDFHKTGCVEASDTDIENAVSVAVAEGDTMLDLIIGITRLDRRSSIVPDFPKANMIYACCGNYKYTLSCSVASEDEEEESGRYLPVDNLICTTAAGMVNADLV